MIKKLKETCEGISRFCWSHLSYWGCIKMVESEFDTSVGICSLAGVPAGRVPAGGGLFSPALFTGSQSCPTVVLLSRTVPGLLLVLKIIANCWWGVTKSHGTQNSRTACEFRFAHSSPRNICLSGWLLLWFMFSLWLSCTTQCGWYCWLNGRRKEQIYE